MGERLYGLLNVLGDLLVEFGLAIAVLVATTGLSRAATILPNRALWRLSDPKSLIICVAESSRSETGKYIRPATGIGQVRALAAIAGSLTKAYGRLDPGNIRLSSDPLAESRETDMVCLGGEKNNEVTRDLLQALSDSGLQVGKSSGSRIIWEVDGKQEVFEAETNAGRVTCDYGLIVRAPNPYCHGKQAIILGGASTFGTVAAARFFVEHCRFRRGAFSAIVKAPVRDDHVLEPQEVRSRSLG